MPAPQQPPPTPTEGDFVLHNFRFTGGEVLPRLNLHYTTLGRRQRNAAGQVDNAVLILHRTGGAGGQFLGPDFADPLYGPGAPLDLHHYYMILPDGIGHGKSSKPSDGLRARFPHYGYRDMVRAQHELLTRHLGVNHLRLVMGTSMGGMQSWMWAEMYPRFLDAAMPLASLPVEIAGRNRWFRRLVMEAIRNSPGYHQGEYTSPPVGIEAAFTALAMLAGSPATMQQQMPTRALADQGYDRMIADELQTQDANDMLYQWEASSDYNPEPELGQIECPLLAVNSADDQVNPPELGVMEACIQKVRRGRYILIPRGPHTRGHGTHSLAAIWRDHLEELLRESARR
ncbi:MAG TPA: alpha/beta fold hydrolase [Terriglobales bacterium]|nr:alpha/beta fold hydrolase [Terriglobales bacterium]